MSRIAISLPRCPWERDYQLLSSILLFSRLACSGGLKAVAPEPRITLATGILWASTYRQIGILVYGSKPGQGGLAPFMTGFAALRENRSSIAPIFPAPLALFFQLSFRDQDHKDLWIHVFPPLILQPVAPRFKKISVMLTYVPPAPPGWSRWSPDRSAGTGSGSGPTAGRPAGRSAGWWSVAGC